MWTKQRNKHEIFVSRFWTKHRFCSAIIIFTSFIFDTFEQTQLPMFSWILLGQYICNITHCKIKTLYPGFIHASLINFYYIIPIISNSENSIHHIIYLNIICFSVIRETQVNIPSILLQSTNQTFAIVPGTFLHLYE